MTEVSPAPETSDSVANTTSGRRNLIILGILAVVFTGITTGVELFIYRTSGDIYLDRSRPGFLPDPGEAEEDSKNSNSAYTFSETGELTRDELKEYIEELEQINQKLDRLVSPYSSAPLSNASLGIDLPTGED